MTQNIQFCTLILVAALLCKSTALWIWRSTLAFIRASIPGLVQQQEYFMPIGEWQPNDSSQQTGIDVVQLEKLIALSQQGHLPELANHLSGSEQQWLATVMHACRNSWLQAVTDMSSDDLVHLMKALAIAETSIAGCTVGEKSPVIYVNRALKQRGASLCKEDLLWIKQHSNNRFLPNGPIL